MQRTVPDAVMAKAGDLPISGPSAVLTQRRALAALMDERAVVVAGSRVPVGYLVAVSGVAVMPVVLLGAMGRVPTDPPRPRSRIDVYFAPPVTVDVAGDPLRSRTRAAVTEQVRQLDERCRGTRRDAKRQGMSGSTRPRDNDQMGEDDE